MICELKEDKKVRILIAKNGQSLRSFAKKIGISHSYLSQILNGKRNPSAIVANKISIGLDTPMEDLFFIGTNDTKKEV